MGLSSRKGIRWLLSFALASSLLGVGGTQAIAGTLDAAASSVEPAGPLGAVMALLLGAEEGDPGSAQPADGIVAQDRSANADEGPQGQGATFPFEVPEERYVYEHVYGVVADDHAVMANANEGDWAYGAATGTLVSKSQGAMLDEGMMVRPRDIGGGAARFSFPSSRMGNGGFGTW